MGRVPCPVPPSRIVCWEGVRGAGSGSATTTAEPGTTSRKQELPLAGPSPSPLQVQTFLKTPSIQSAPFPVVGAHCAGAKILNLHGPLGLLPIFPSPLRYLSTSSCLSRQQTPGICQQLWSPSNLGTTATEAAMGRDTEQPMQRPQPGLNKPHLTRILPPAWLRHLPK